MVCLVLKHTYIPTGIKRELVTFDFELQFEGAYCQDFT